MKTYHLEPTKHPDLFRNVDRDGNWKEYFHAPTRLYLRGVTTILDRGYAKPELLQWAKNHSREEIDEKLQVAGDKGDAVHQAIAGLLAIGSFERDLQILADDNKNNRRLTDDEWDCLLSFAEFWNRHKAICLSSEEAVFNLQIGYAGTLDGLVVMTQACGVKACPCGNFIGQVGLFDWKSGGGIYESFGAQVAAYANAENLPHPSNYTAILRVGTAHKTTGGYQLEIYDIPQTAQHLAEFVAAQTIDDATYKPFDPEKEIREIPDSIRIELPEAQRTHMGFPVFGPKTKTQPVSQLEIHKQIDEITEPAKSSGKPKSQRNGQGKRNRPGAPRAPKAPARHKAA